MQKCESRKSRPVLNKGCVVLHFQLIIWGHFFALNFVVLMHKFENINQMHHQGDNVSKRGNLSHICRALNWTLQYHHFFQPCQPPPLYVPSVQEQSENGFSSAGLTVISGDNPAGLTSSANAIRRMGPLETLDSHRPITVHFGQVRVNYTMLGAIYYLDGNKLKLISFYKIHIFKLLFPTTLEQLYLDIFVTL